MARVARILWAILLAGSALVAHDLQSVESRLKADFEGKALTLRQSNCNKQIRFDAQGVLIGQVKEGPWTLCSKVKVHRLRLKPGELMLEGNRVWVVFNPSAVYLDSGEQLRIKFQPIPDSADPAVLNRLLAGVFVTTDQTLEQAPETWKPYLSGALGPKAKDSLAAPVARCGGGKVSTVEEDPAIRVPELVFRKEPNYSARARAARVEGTVVFLAIVMTDGKLCGTTIYRPLGLGLDEEALRAISEWRFRPATKDGKAVRLGVTVEVTFRLL